MGFDRKTEEHPFSFERETFIQDQQTGDQFGLPALGTYPEGVPDIPIVLVAPTRRPDFATDRRLFQVLGVVECESLPKAVRTLWQLKEDHFVPPGFIFGDISNETVMQEFRRLQPGFTIRQAPNSDDPAGFALYMRTLRDMLSPDRKTLFLGENSPIATILKSMDEQTLRGASARKFPMLAALMYAVSGLQRYKQVPDHTDADLMPEIYGEEGI